MIRFAVALFLGLVASNAQAEVPLSRAASGQVTAPVRIGGGAATAFVVDTGADGCSVTERFAAQRRLLKLGGETGDPRVLAPDVEIDGQAIGALPCVVLANPTAGAAFDGVIGADALARFVVTFDMQRMRLAVRGGAQHGQALVSPRARLVDAQRLPGGLLAVPVRFDNAVGAAVLATGARRSALNARFAEASGVTEDARSPEAVRGALDIGGKVTPAVEVRIDNLPVFAAFGLADRPAMILGLDRLAGTIVVIDYPRRRIWFDPG